MLDHPAPWDLFEHGRFIELEAQYGMAADRAYAVGLPEECPAISAQSRERECPSQWTSTSNTSTIAG